LSAAGTKRGRRGCSGELVEAPKCTRQRDIERGLSLTVRKRRRRARKQSGCAGEEARQRRRTGGVPVWSRARLLRAPGTRTCGSTSLMSPWRTHESRKKSGRANPSLVATSSRRRRGTEAAVLGKIGAQVRVVVCFECKGVSRSSSSSLYKNSEGERERRGEAEGSRGGACH
jgi:hypothetical protein